jgi:hypothetical protein
MIKLFLALTAAALLCGCAAAIPAASSSASLLGRPTATIHTHTSVNLAAGNFSVVKTNVVGISKGFSLLGLIPIYPATVTKAMGRLYAQAGMQEGETKTIAHLVIDHSSLYFLLFSIPETTARADIVEFHAKAAPENGGKTGGGS